MNTPKPTNEELRELAALAYKPQINTFLERWKADLGVAVISSNDDNAIKRLQGAARAVDALATLIEQAKEELRRAK